MGLIDLAEEIFHMPVRMGGPQNVTGLTEVVKKSDSLYRSRIINVRKRTPGCWQGH